MQRFVRRLSIATTLALAIPLLVATTSFSAAADVTVAAPAPAPLAEDDARLVPGVAPVPTVAAPDQAGRMAAPVNHEIFVNVVQVTPGNGADDSNAITAAKIQTLIANMNAFWMAQSGGAVSVSLGGTSTQPTSVTSCNLNALYTAQPMVAFGGAFANYDWVGSNDHLLVLTQEDCGGGLGSIGGDGGQMVSGAGAVGGFAKVVGLHEFGHNLGFGHADSTLCRNTTHFDGPASQISFGSSTCPTFEYGDNIDVMGSSSDIPGGLSSPGRIAAGYLTDYVTLSGDYAPTTVTLMPLSNGSGTRAIQIVDTVSGEIYYIEYRINSGQDANTYAFWYPGSPPCIDLSGYTLCEADVGTPAGAIRVIRTLVDEYGTVDSTVMTVGTLASNPTDRTTRHGYLRVGESFTSQTGSFTVKVNSKNGASGSSITITPVKAPTVTSLTSSRTTQGHGTTNPAVLTAQVQRVSGLYPAGSVKFYDGTVAIATVPVSTATGKAIYKVSPLLTARVHSLTAVFKPTLASAYAESTSSAVTITVSKAVSSVTMTLSQTTVAINTPTSVTVTVSAPGVTKPVGTLSVYSGTTLLGQAQLLATHSGTMQLTIPGFATAGVRSINVKYSGNTNITSYQTASKPLTVN